MLGRLGEGDYTPPTPSRRTLGDHLHPLRPVRPTDLVNAVSRTVSDDVAPWRWERVLAMYAQLEAADQQRPDA